MTREVEHAPYLETGLSNRCIDDFLAALRAPVLGVHRIQHHGSIGVKAHPVVREHRVGFDRRICVWSHAHPHALRGQRCRKSVEFAQRPLRRVANAPGMLEAIGARGLRVVAEVSGTNHQHGAGTL